MNHLTTIFKTRDGGEIPYQTWEKNIGAYKRIALVIQGPFLSMNKNKRMINFLLENNFKIYVPELLESRGLDSYIKHLDEFRSFINENEENIKIIPFSFSTNCLPFLYYCLNFFPVFKLFILISPILDFFSYPLKGLLYFKKNKKLDIRDEVLVSGGQDSGIEYPIADQKGMISCKFIRGTRKKQKDIIIESFLSSLKCSAGIFYGEEDSMVAINSIDTITKGADERLVSCFSYPRSRHILSYGKYYKNFYRDLKLFIEAHESF